MYSLRFLVLFLFLECSGFHTPKSGRATFKAFKEDSLLASRSGKTQSRVGKISKYLGAGALGILSFWAAKGYQQSDGGEVMNLNSNQNDLNSNRIFDSFDGILDNGNEFEMFRRDTPAGVDGEGVLGIVDYSVSDEKFVITGPTSFDVLADKDFYAIYDRYWTLGSEGWSYSKINFIVSPIWGDRSPEFNKDVFSYASFIPLNKNKIAMARCEKEEDGCSFHIKESSISRGTISSDRNFISRVPNCSCDKSTQSVRLIDSAKYGLIALWSGSTNGGDVYLSSIDLEQSEPSLNTKILEDIDGTVYSAKLIKEGYLLANIMNRSQTLFLLNMDSLSVADQITNPAKGLTQLFIFNDGVGAVRGSNYVFPLKIEGNKIVSGESSNDISESLSIKGTKDGLVELSSTANGVTWKLYDSELLLVDRGEVLLGDLSDNELRWDCLKGSASCLIIYGKDGSKQMREIFFTKKKTNP